MEHLLQCSDEYHSAYIDSYTFESANVRFDFDIAVVQNTFRYRPMAPSKSPLLSTAVAVLQVRVCCFHSRSQKLNSLFLSSVSDGASLMEEDDSEQGEEFDFDDWDDTRPGISNPTTEASDLIKANKPETQGQETARQDVNGPTGPWLKGKNSLYQQCINSSGKEVCILLM